MQNDIKFQNTVLNQSFPWTKTYRILLPILISLISFDESLVSHVKCLSGVFLNFYHNQRPQTRGNIVVDLWHSSHTDRNRKFGGVSGRPVMRHLFSADVILLRKVLYFTI